MSEQLATVCPYGSYDGKASIPQGPYIMPLVLFFRLPCIVLERFVVDVYRVMKV